MKPKPIHPVFILLAVALVLALAYFETYAATVEPVARVFTAPLYSPTTAILLHSGCSVIFPRYPVLDFLGSDRVEWLFRPAFELDKLIRPAKWKP